MISYLLTPCMYAHFDLCLHYCLGNPRWREYLKTHRNELNTDLAPIADELLCIFRKHISNTLYHKVYRAFNPIVKISLLLDVVYEHNDTDIYVQFCDAVKILGFRELSQELRSILD